MKKLFKLLIILLAIANASLAFSQDVNTMLKEADNLEIKLNEPAALDKYKQILLVEANNIKALVKATELSCSIGARLKEKKDKQLYYQSALAFAQRAIAADANNADANYAMASASGKMTEVETENKKVVAYVKDIKLYADKALAVNPNHGKANYTLGKWHIEMVNLSGFKKAAVKLFYGGLPEATVENAIKYMEKCRQFEPYFMLNYLELAKVYKQDNKPPKAIEVLQKLVKLPIRTFDDTAIKAEGQQLLNSML
jgi:hypothetical protein